MPPFHMALRNTQALLHQVVHLHIPPFEGSMIQSYP